MLPIVTVTAIHAAEMPPVHELGSVMPALVDLNANAAAADLVSDPDVLTVLANPEGAVTIAVAVNWLAAVRTALFAHGTITAGLFGFELVAVVELD